MKDRYKEFSESRIRHTRNHNKDSIFIVRIFVSFFIIVISIFAINTVIVKVMDIKILEKIDLKPESHDSLNITTDTNSGNSLLIKDEKGLRFRKEDKSFAREEWIEKNGELFYFDTAGYGLNGDLKNDGQVYTFDNGKLKTIKRDTSYVNRAEDDLYSSIKSSQYLVWLVDSEKEKNYYPIRYRIINEDEEDYLGTEADKQYASPNMIKIYMSNIYYLAVGKNTDYAGRLYRMRPGAIHKEVVGVGVTGFIVLSDDVVYYCDGDKVLKAKSWRGIELKLPDDEELSDDGEIIFKKSTASEISDEITSIDINDLPKPDNDTFDNNVPKSDLTIKEDETIKETTKKNIDSLPINDILSESTRKPVKEELVEVGVGPQVIEVEAPQ